MNLYLNYIALLYISVYLFTLKHLFIQIVSLNVVAVVLDSAFALLVCQSVDLSAAVSTSRPLEFPRLYKHDISSHE